MCTEQGSYRTCVEAVFLTEYLGKDPLGEHEGRTGALISTSESSGGSSVTGMVASDLEKMSRGSATNASLVALTAKRDGNHGASVWETLLFLWSHIVGD